MNDAVIDQPQKKWLTGENIKTTLMGLISQEGYKMKTILCLGVLALLTGCCNGWHQVPENPHYKAPENKSAQ